MTASGTSTKLDLLLVRFMALKFKMTSKSQSRMQNRCCFQYQLQQSSMQHGFLRVLGIFTNGPKKQRDCILFVKWLDGAFAHNARSGRSIYKPHPPVSRCIGYMRDTKGYSVKKSAYAFVPVSEGNVLAPVWLQPDPADRKRERFIAMKNNDAGDWDQTPS